MHIHVKAGAGIIKRVSSYHSLIRNEMYGTFGIKSYTIKVMDNKWLMPPCYMWSPTNQRQVEFKAIVGRLLGETIRGRDAVIPSPAVLEGSPV